MSYLENVLGRATGTVPVMRPRPKALFEDGLPLSIGESTEEATPAPPAEARSPARDPAPPSRRLSPSLEPHRLVEPSPHVPEPGPVHTIERIERIIERTPVEQPAAPVRERLTPLPPAQVTPPRAPPVELPRHVLEKLPRPVPAEPGRPPRLPLEQRIETVLGPERQSPERERVIERIAGPAAPEQARRAGPPEASTRAAPVVQTLTSIARSARAAAPPALPAHPAPAVPAVAPAVVPARPAARVRAVPPEPTPRPIVHVSIGQVEIRAMPSRAPQSRTAPRPAQPALTLDDYLRERNGRAP